MLNFKKMSKVERQYRIKHLLYVILGSFSLAFGTAIFLANLNIVSGGLSGIAIIISHYLPADFLGGQTIDIIAFVFTWLLWIVGLIFVGKEFAFNTLLSSILYPLALALFLRIPIFIEISESISFYGLDESLIEGIKAGTASSPIGNLLLCALFSGVFIGTGVAYTFKGGGSSGGVDVLIALGNKYFGIKESILSFLIDGIIIVCGMFLIPNNIVPSLCGIISACVTALMIEYFYIGKQTSFQADIISDKWQEISEFVQNSLGRGATIIDAKGGYRQDDRVVLRVVFDKTQYKAMREFIGKIDPKAFMTFTQTYGVYGEGFKTNKPNKKEK